MKKYTIFGICAIALLLNTACKKTEDSSTSTPSLGGLTINSVPAYLPKDIVLTFQADVSDITASDGSDHIVGLYWQVNSAAKKDTTTRNTKLKNPPFEYSVDTLGLYDVYCYAFTPDNTCYATSVVSSFQAIKPDEALTGLAEAKEITVGGITWQAYNLNNPNMGVSYRESPILDDVMGRLYTWEEAQTACPAGWHLPSAADFATSFTAVGGSDIMAGALMAKASFLEKEMWEYWPDVQITNAFGFNAIPVGYVDMSDKFTTYDHYGEYACWWTSDQNNGKGTCMYIFEDNPKVQTFDGDKSSIYMSVRCVKD